MTDKEIIKALKCCIKPTSDCDNCPYYGYDDDLQCFDMSKRDVLDLINRQQFQLDNYSHNVRNMTKDFNEQYKIIKQQQAEIQALREDIHNRKARENKLRSKIKSFKAEIERLKNEIAIQEHAKCLPCIEETKIQAIKEFADRLKIKTKGLLGENFIKEHVDNLVKEMVGDDK